MNINISGEVVRTSQLPKRIIGLGDYLVALNSSPLETSTVLVSDFVSFLNTQFATSLASLTDVSINGPLPGQALVFNGSYWVNQGIGELDTLDSVTTRGNTTTNSITVGGLYSPYLRLDTVATPTLQAGMFAWNDVDGTANLRLKGNNVTLQIGQETVARVVNKTGADLLESEYKVVRVRVASEGGAQGQRLAVVLAQGDNDPDSATTLGVVTENIGNNQEGFITIFGNVNGINTTGSLQGETWVDGDVLYLSPTTPGGLTKVKPQAPQHTLIVGYVVYAHQNNGKIFVKVDNGYELDELHNVLISNPNNNDILQYNSTQQVWKNIAASVAVPTPTLAQVTTAGNTTTNNITVGTLYFGNGNHYLVTDNGSYAMLSSNRTLQLATSGNPVLSVFTSQNVAIGTTTDAGYKLDVNGTTRVQGNSLIKGSDDTNQNFALQITNLSGTTKFQVGNGSQNVRFDQWQPLGGGSSVSWTPGGGISLGVGSNTSNQTYTGITYGGGQSGSSTTGSYTSLNLTPAINQTGASGATTRGIYINPTLTSAYDFRAIETVRGNVVFGSTSGNVLIGTTTDSGYKLDVNGTARVVDTSNYGDVFVVRTPGIGWSFDYQYLKIGVVLKLGTDRLQLRVNNNTAYVYNNGDSGNSSLTIMGGHDGAITQFAPIIFGSGRDASLVRETMRVDNQNQRVGIGTTSPIYNLEVSSTSGTGFGIMSGANSGAEIGFQNRGYGLPRWTIRATGAPDGSSGELTFQRLASSFDLTIKSTGNVLIGTTTDAGYKLDVNGTGRFSGNLEINAGANGQIFINNLYPRLLFGKTGTPNWSMFADTENSGQFEIGTGAGFPYNTFTSRVYISSAGNVGIGITPIYKLDVNGSVRFQSTGTTSVTHSFLFRNDNSAYGGFTIGSSGQSLSIQQNSGYGYLSAAGFNFGSTNSNIWTNNGSVLDIQNAAGSTTYLRIANTTGNVLIGTTTDSGYKLDVNGTGRYVDTIRIAQSGFLRNADITMGNSLNINASHGGIAFSYVGNNIVNFGGTNNQFFKQTQIGYGTALITRNASLSVGGSITASTALAQGILYDGTLVAAANNDVLVGLDINPTYTLGAFTGTQRHGVRIQNSRLYITGSYSALSSEALNPDSLVHIDATINGRGGSRAIAVRINPTININGAGSQTFAALEVKPTFTNNTNNSTELAINTDGPNFLGGVNTLGWWTYWPGLGGSSTYHIVNAPNGQGFRVQINSNIAGYSYEFNGSGIPTYTLRNNNIDALKVYSTGNVGINTSTDAGYKLDVNGSQRILGNLTITAGGSGTNTFNANVNYLFANQNNVYGLVDLQNAAGQGVFLKVTGTPTAGTGFDYFWISGTTTSSTVGTTRNIFNVNPTYNLTGAFTGTMRGFYYNPVLTSMTGATHRAIETTSGDVIFNGGNVGIGTTGLVPGYLLTINGGVSIAAGQSLSLDPSAGIYMVASSSQFRLYNNSIAALSVASTGNVLINTTTDSGYKLDVNGTARFTGNVSLGSPNINDKLEVYGNILIRANDRIRLAGTSDGNTAIYAASAVNITANVRQNGSGTFDVTFGALGSQTRVFRVNDHTGHANVVIGVNAVSSATAVLQADSTTQGFLPPRLTTAQILLIASPAEGLQVYNTDLKTICFYNGTAWQRVTSTAM